MGENSSMKVVIVSFGFPPCHVGGSEVAAYNIARTLAKRGHEVHVIARHGKSLTNYELVEGFYLHRVKLPRIRFLETILFCLRALLIVKKLNPDIVHAQAIGAGITGLLAKRLWKKAYVVYCQGSEVYLWWLFKRPIARSVLKNADEVITLTEDMKRQAQQLCDREMLVIPNGVDLERFEDLPAREMLRIELGFDQDEKVILFVGNLRSVKGARYLIEAMRLIKDKNASARLTLIGDGEERGALQNHVKELELERYVTFVGRVSSEKVPGYMAASDTFVLPSLSEGFPVVIAEAMAAGLPIITTRIGGLPEIIQDGENGFLVEPMSPEQIAEKVLLLLEDDELRQRISSNNRARVKEYSWESIVQKLEKVYQKLYRN